MHAFIADQIRSRPVRNVFLRTYRAFVAQHEVGDVQPGALGNLQEFGGVGERKRDCGDVASDASLGALASASVTTNPPPTE